MVRLQRQMEICCHVAAKPSERGSTKLLRYLVDLIGIEPMTSSMPSLIQSLTCCIYKALVAP